MNCKQHFKKMNRMKNSRVGKPCSAFVFVLFCFGGTGVSTKGFSLAKQVLYHLSHTSSPRVGKS
jgi:hypothetical protein